jgi:hypothetical protein
MKQTTVIVPFTSVGFDVEGTRQFLVLTMLTGQFPEKMKSDLQPRNKSMKLTLRNEDESSTA